MSYFEPECQLPAQSPEKLRENARVGESKIAAGQGAEVTVLRTHEQLEEIRSLWIEWQRHPNADIDVFQRSLRVLPGVIGPYVLVLYRSGTPRAMLVGRLERGIVSSTIGYYSVLKCQARMMTFIRGGHLGSASPEDSEELVKAILSRLKFGDGDAAYFNHLEAESVVYRTLAKIPGALVRDHFPSISTHWKMVLPSSGSEIYDSLGAKRRKTLKWQMKKVNEQFGAALCIRRFAEPDELGVMFQDVEEIAKKTYQRGLGVGFRNDSEMRDRMRFAAERKWLRGYVLYVDDTPVAFWMGVLYRGTFHSDFMGYDPAYGKHSPGMYLILRVIEELCDKGEKDVAEAVDFGLGDAQYKAILGNTRWCDGSLYVFAPSLRGIGLNALRTPALLLNGAATHVVNRLGVGPKIKRLWRNLLISGERRAGMRAT